MVLVWGIWNLFVEDKCVLPSLQIFMSVSLKQKLLNISRNIQQFYYQARRDTMHHAKAIWVGSWIFNLKLFIWWQIIWRIVASQLFFLPWHHMTTNLINLEICLRNYFLNLNIWIQATRFMQYTLDFRRNGLLAKIF